MKKPETPTRLLLREVREQGYYHLTASVVAVEEGDTLRNTDTSNGLFVADLRVSSQGNDDDREKRDGGRHLYGWVVRFQDVYAVTDSIAAGMTRTFKVLDRRMEKLAAQHGRPVTFAQYLGRVALALGCEGFVIKKGDGGPARFGYDASTWRFLTLAQGIDLAGDIEICWQKETK